MPPVPESVPRGIRSLPALLLALAIGTRSAAAPHSPPGFRPEPATVHALVGARVFPSPWVELDRATVVIRDGIVTEVGRDVRPPADARIWDLAGRTLYAGFFDPYVTLSVSNAPGSTAERDAGNGAPTSGGYRFFGTGGDEADPGTPGPGHSVRGVTPERRIASTLAPGTEVRESLRALGFVAANFVPADGLFRGQSATATLGDTTPNQALIAPDSAQVIAFDVPGGRDHFPASPMGVVAAIRQTFLDADHQARMEQRHAEDPRGTPRPPHNESLAALRAVRRGQPVLFVPGGVLLGDRAHHVAAELGLDRRVFLASGQEWRRPDLAVHPGSQFIAPLHFPALPKLPSDDDWEQVDLDTLRHWDWAPENPAVLRRAGAAVSLTTHGLTDRKDFRKRLREAMDRGLSATDALAALTTEPARQLGLDDRLGTIAVGRPAHLTVVAGDYFDPDARVEAVWIHGRRHPGAPDPSTDEKTDESKEREREKARELRRIARKRVARAPLSDRGALNQPPAVAVRNAVLWTSASHGVLSNAVLVARAGRITAVGSEAETPIPPDAWILDAAGHHVTPGLIDCHSHSMLLGVNEPTLPSTAMVRMADVVDSESPNIRLQLAGGLTIANLLHGSANPIGGQNCVIKLRDGAGPEELRMAGAPPGIKFALGENVKQANWGEKFTTRFPQTRMGVPVFLRNRFLAARQYRAARDAGEPVRRDLELEALAEILEGTRLIHCHSYRQDEVLVFLRTMEELGIRVATLQHILEGYKVADEIARHGAGASAFADWWAYKFEVIDAIPHAGSLLHQRGVEVSFNSDSDDHARRLNLEAAKAVKYGATAEADALRFVTLNPARQLGIADRVGSLEVGKDADFVVWSGHPLDSRSVCLETWIDGRQYYDRQREPGRAAALGAERDALIAKARRLAGKDGDKAASDPAREQFFRAARERAHRLAGGSVCMECDQP